MPVDWEGLGLIDYPTFVKNPMDLSTVNKYLNEEKYQSIEEVLDDLQLIWDNCKIYNKKGSVIHILFSGFGIWLINLSVFLNDW